MDYKKLLKLANKKFKHFTVDTIGQSVCGRKILKWSCIFDNARPFVLMQGSMHAREYICSDVLARFIELIESDYYNLRDIGTPNIIIIPMVNPDGVELVKYGLKSAPRRLHNKLLDINNGNNDFSMFKANINGVDLNNNFNAKWFRHHYSLKPSQSGFRGDCYESEVETKALVSVTKFYNVVFTISFHSKGEEIYYNFYQKGLIKQRDKDIAQIISKATSYKIKNVQSKSSGGYKDWCVEKLKIPAVTIEVGEDSLIHPISEKYAENIFYKVRNICYTLCDIIGVVDEYDGRKVYDRSNHFGKKS